jgi:hypothetical protein
MEKETKYIVIKRIFSTEKGKIPIVGEIFKPKEYDLSPIEIKFFLSFGFIKQYGKRN